MVDGDIFSPEQLQTLLSAFIDDLEVIGFKVELGEMPIQEKILFVLPIWHHHRAQIAAVRGPTSMAAELLWD